MAVLIFTTSAGCSQSPRTLSFLPEAGDIQQIDIEDVVRGPEAAATLFPKRTYTIESTAPPQAFAELRPCLKREELDRLTQAAVGAVQ